MNIVWDKLTVPLQSPGVDMGLTRFNGHGFTSS
jgi:hypothetical protein